MICPQCRSEYRAGFTRCADCNVDLVDSLPSPVEQRESIKLTRVYETGSPALIPVLQSLFADAGIEYMTTSENLQDLVAGGRVGGGYNFAIGPVGFYVRSEDVKDAEEIIARLSEPPPPEEPAETI